MPYQLFKNSSISFLILFLDLYEATLDATWIEWADILQKRQNELFWDSQNFGYFTAPADDDSIILRLKEDQGGNQVKYEVF